MHPSLLAETAPPSALDTASVVLPSAVAPTVLDLVGSTPVVQLRGLPASAGTVVAKLEGLNPGGSMKDRTAAHMLREAIRRGDLLPGGQVVESTSGNLGTGLAQAAAVLGLRLTCVVDPRCPRTSILTMRALGARVVEITEPDPETGDLLAARLAEVRRLLADDPTAYWPNQYANLDNPAAHAAGTMAELDDLFGGSLDTVYVATSTTGTLRGCADLLAARGRATRLVAVDAAGSVLFGGQRATRLLPGYGAGVVPPLARTGDPDEVVRVADRDAVAWCRRLARTDGLLVGASGGAVVAAAAAGSPAAPGGTVALILADRGAAYLDTVYDDGWVQERFGEIPAVVGSPVPGYAGPAA